MNVGVNVAILQDDKILLTKREDFEVWCLPGGHIDEGESVAEAAIREMAEETGLDIQLTRLVGIYSLPHATAWVNLIILFAAKVVGGSLQKQQDEVLEIAYFSRDEIPKELLLGHRQRIADAFDRKGGGTVWQQDVPFSLGLDRQDLYRLRDESGLDKQAFYAQNFGWDDPTTDRSEL